MISLKKLKHENWEECIKLKVSNDQKKFLGTNENSLAVAYVYKEMEPRAIYSDDVMVGFIMYAKDPDSGLFYINRFMIDEKYQKKGYGKQALELLLNELKDMKVESLDILHKPDNNIAIKLYNELGFELTDRKLDDDLISTIKLDSR